MEGEKYKGPAILLRFPCMFLFQVQSEKKTEQKKLWSLLKETGIFHRAEYM